MTLSALNAWVLSSLLLGLRIAPVFLLAPPFALIKMPRLFHILFGFGLATCLVSINPEAMLAVDAGLGEIITAAFRELALGAMFVLAFQLPFAALYFAGRTIDVQAGYGLALLIDPTSKAQMPLVGTLFAYMAAAIFFAADGHIDLLRLFSASLERIPIGGWTMPTTIERLTAFISAVFLMAFGVAAASVLSLFLIDLVIALLSRTVPQMNVLILGFQVKAIVLFLVLPVSLGLGGVILLRLMALMLQVIPGLL